MHSVFEAPHIYAQLTSCIELYASNIAKFEDLQTNGLLGENNHEL